MTKRRKALDDALAQEFVYGAKQTQEVVPETSLQEAQPDASHPAVTPPIQQPRKSTLMDKLQVEPKEATVRFTVDMPESMHRKLSLLAAQTGKKKVEIVRMLLDEALQDVET
ncbi:MAG: hypothetical protein F6K19_05055 [Cyanothece sp. SIO1E1]|nr:hypothetical protein [Cyanothece sp. SIO1E1]